MLAFRRETGCDQLKANVKSDNGSAMVDLVERVGKVRASRGAQTMVIESSVLYATARKELMERGVTSVQGHVRVWRGHVEGTLGCTILVGHPMWPRLVEHSAFFLNRGEVGRDAQTSYERRKGKRGRLPGVAFAEPVVWKGDRWPEQWRR